MRTVNATFDDTLGRVDWFDDDGSRPENGQAGYGLWRSPASAEANTDRFLDGLTAYRDHGVLAVNLNFQGGHPLNGKPWIEEGHGSAGRRLDGHRGFYHNSAFDADGAIDASHAARLARVIEACDRLGMAVVLQLFYFGQDTVFDDGDGVRAATDRAVDFVCERCYGNVIVEIANEIMEGARAILRGRFNVAIEDVQALALPVMRHRMGLNFAAQSDGVNTDDVVSQLLESIPTGGELYDGAAKAAG